VKGETMGSDFLERLFSLKGKTAVVTGGYKGIGRIFSETYAEAGADVVIVARNTEGCRKAAREISERYGVDAIGESMNVNDSAQVNRVIKGIIERFQKIDILVNNAGVTGSEKPILKMSDEDLDDVMNVDFRGLFLTSRAVGKHMADRKCGKIINVASILGKVAARNMAGYCSSKAAVIQLTRVMALEFIRDNIQVNTLCPGYFLTDFNKDFFDSDAGQKMIRKMIPINRVGDPNELKSTVLFLATCPAFMTGTEIYVDGGHTVA
jgi:NAD(P)-dependent dehydrogenase (short-subunit alcohol dehydrogenase family)